MTHLDAQLLAYLDGELSPAEMQSVEAHLSQCACSTWLKQVRALRRGLTRHRAAPTQSVALGSRQASTSASRAGG